MSRRSKKAKALLLAGPKKEPEVAAAEVTQVQLMKRPHFDWPELYCNVYITEPGYEMAMGSMFGRARCYKANTVDEADIVVFCGGADVNPTLYHEEPHKSFRGDDARDQRDMQLYLECVEKRVPMVGVCRGAQFLHVMNGGKLIQDLDGHQGDHALILTNGNEVKGEGTGGAFIDRISSTHHQAVIAGEGMDVLGYVWRSDRRDLNPTVTQTGRARDIEAFFYPETCCLGFQGHPEYAGYYKYTKWCLEMVQRHIVDNKDIVVDGKRYRHKRSVILGLPGPVNKKK
jgi:gamma-glutamyl-gamma-aminobutyrate hydrolase PuuD